jgi:hypothetical protein
MTHCVSMETGRCSISVAWNRASIRVIDKSSLTAYLAFNTEFLTLVVILLHNRFSYPAAIRSMLGTAGLVLVHQTKLGHFKRLSDNFLLSYHERRCCTIQHVNLGLLACWLAGWVCLEREKDSLQVIALAAFKVFRSLSKSA